MPNASLQGSAPSTTLPPVGLFSAFWVRPYTRPYLGHWTSHQDCTYGRWCFWDGPAAIGLPFISLLVFWGRSGRGAVLFLSCFPRMIPLLDWWAVFRISVLWDHQILMVLHLPLMSWGRGMCKTIWKYCLWGNDSARFWAFSIVRPVVYMTGILEFTFAIFFCSEIVCFHLHSTLELLSVPSQYSRKIYRSVYQELDRTCSTWLDSSSHTTLDFFSNFNDSCRSSWLYNL